MRGEPAVEIRVLLLTGTIGVGKTTLAEAISEELHEQERRHALIDLDWLGQVYPLPDGHQPYSYQLALENLAAIWSNFIKAGAERAVVAGTILDREQLDRFRRAVGRGRVTVALVWAPEEMVKERIAKRDRGALLGDFLSRSAAVAAEIEAADIHDLVAVNNEIDPRPLARDLLRRLAWI